MDRNPRGDKLQPGPADSAADQWIRVLAHRQKDAPATVASVIERFDAAGVTPNQVASHLEDGGDRLYAAASSGVQTGPSSSAGSEPSLCWPLRSAR